MQCFDQGAAFIGMIGHDILVTLILRHHRLTLPNTLDGINTVPKLGRGFETLVFSRLFHLAFQGFK